MTGGAGLDFVLAMLAAVAVIFLLRSRFRETSPRGRTSGAADASRAEELIRQLRGYYPQVARQAGYDPDRLRFVYWLAKVVLGVVLPLLLVEVRSAAPAPTPWPGAVALGLLGFLAPDGWLLLTRRRRRRRVESSLSFFLDLLVALLYAGMGLGRAFREAGRGLRFGRSHPLADEVELVALELDLGKERGAAFEALAERTGVKELRGVAVALKTGMRLGVSVEETLGAQAELLREKRRQEAHKRINRAAIEALVPTLLCGFPILLLLIFFPAALELMEAIAALREYIR